jgi:hypothetical protein
MLLASTTDSTIISLKLLWLFSETYLTTHCWFQRTNLFIKLEAKFKLLSNTHIQIIREHLDQNPLMEEIQTLMYELKKSVKIDCGGLKCENG